MTFFKKNIGNIAIFSVYIFIFFIFYLFISGLFGCNFQYGLGIYTADGACENYIYGYSVVGQFIDYLTPLFVAIYVGSYFKLPRLFSFIFSALLYALVITLIVLVKGAIL
ncbi:hypothetical protein DQ393_10160 [Rhizobium tropici]|uniref:Uncharacterized protein n=1 Tax=Rhizobium tropici TaxID=398 RepID=A0A329YDE0_RHITR|nr:hypothetical protein DQ393_10160 [Rhizobium tropici]